MELWDKLNKYKNGDLSHSEQVAVFFDIYPQKRSALENILCFEDRFSRKKVTEALDQKFQELLEIRKHNTYAKFSAPVSKNKQIDPSVLPVELRQERTRLSPLIIELSHKQGRLFHCSTNEQRFALAKEIIKLTRERRSILNKIDEFMASGSYTKPEESVRTSPAKNITNELPAEEFKRLLQLRAQRSKLKNKPNRLADYNAIVKEINALESKRS